jgi:hypothetical protein
MSATELPPLPVVVVPVPVVVPVLPPAPPDVLVDPDVPPSCPPSTRVAPPQCKSKIETKPANRKEVFAIVGVYVRIG